MTPFFISFSPSDLTIAQGVLVISDFKKVKNGEKIIKKGETRRK